MNRLKVFWLLVVAAVGTLALTGCGKDPTSPGVQPELTNSVDSFQYQVTDVKNYTREVTFSWQNTGTMATVNQATTFTKGGATLVLLDANRVQVYSRSLAENGTFAGAAGAPGSWTIRVTFNNASGTVNFRAQKAI